MTLGTNYELLIYPFQFEFYSDEHKSLQQEINLHNQFDFAVKYKILTTAPKKYTVKNPEGSVPPKSSLDLIVKHSSSCFGVENATDKLRVKFYHDGNVLCKKDVPLYSIVSRREHVLAQMMNKNSLNQSNYSNDSSEEKYSHTSFSYGNSLNDMMASQNDLMRARQSKEQKKNAKVDRHKFYADQISLYNGDNVNYLVIIIGLICLTILFLPNYVVESQSSPLSNYLPLYLHVSYEIKLFCSFVLGMVTMVILKN